MDEIKYSVQEKAIALFKYTKELNALKQKTIVKVSDYPWHKMLNSIHSDKDNIQIHFRDRTEKEETDLSPVLFSIHKPEFEKCPQPEDILLDWLEPHWDNFRNEAKVLKRRVYDKDGKEIFNWVEPNPVKKDQLSPLDLKPAKNEQLSLLDSTPANNEQLSLLDSDAIADKETDNLSSNLEDNVTIILFEDDKARTAAFENWKKKRAIWVERQTVIYATRSLFMEFYQQYIDLQRDIEFEMIVANGEIKDRDSDIDQVVLTRRVNIRYDPIENTIFVEDTDNNTDLYSVLFQALQDINLDKLGELRDKLMQYDYHPLDRNDTPDYLMEMIRQFTSDSLFCKDEIPENWKQEHRYLMVMNPVFITRKRVDGTLKAIDSILQNIEETGYVPEPIRELVSGGTITIPEESEEISIEEKLAEVGGESKDILLSKAANREQLEIAKRIDFYNAVLVQGPPGTGKTHTIANLTGHFLAQGKSVLITSYTSKALNVLKEKIPQEIQDLCVSVLDDSNADMEKSVNGITEYSASHSSSELRKKMAETQAKRVAIMEDLSETRKKLFALIHQEKSTIVINGEGISPSRAAAFVTEHAEELNYIPGKITLTDPLPLTDTELSDLYRSNTAVTQEEEAELAFSLPSPAELLSPEEFKDTQYIIQRSDAAIREIAAFKNWTVNISNDACFVYYQIPDQKFTVPLSNKENIKSLVSFIASFQAADPWMVQAAVDGKKAGNYLGRWNTLLDQIEETCDFSDSIVSDTFGKKITYSDAYNFLLYKNEFKELKYKFKEKGKISKIFLRKRLSEALESVLIDGREIRDDEECSIFLNLIHLDEMRRQCAAYWDDLLKPFGVSEFIDLDEKDPEHVAKNWISNIERYLAWYHEDYKELQNLLALNNIPEQELFGFSTLDTDTSSTEKILYTVKDILPSLCKCQYAALNINENNAKLEKLKEVLSDGSRRQSPSCKDLLIAIDNREPAEYKTAFQKLAALFEKYDLLAKREKLLEKLQPYAPQWALAITNRMGIHGNSTPPEDIHDAWKWKQLTGKLEEITSQPYEELQKKGITLSKEYRTVTAEYAGYCAWYYLLRRTEQNLTMKMALQGWRRAIKLIGKGTGNKKRIAELRAEARKNMAICQRSVPAWIMPINKVLDNFIPGKNTFDIVIIDEASQADLSSLAILYMGKKLIIVGDDEQVSPMAVGAEVEKMIALKDEYIKDKIPNAFLYDSKCSIYALALTTFQPLMLKEHFRCVPEIIGFSNWLSYEYKIKPLRDAGSSNLLPAVVNYRVSDGKRPENKKTNPQEALTIVALMKACMEQPEYDGKSFGVISLLGDEQVKNVQQDLMKYIDQRDLEARRVLCGNSANFQGDERDVIFLSLVDSNDGDGPIRMMGDGTDQAFKKRYNVAASRARDQLWVVHSLDPANDLQPNDLRKKLIDYSLDPEAFDIIAQKVEHDSESPFEESVAKALISHGYHLVQQWKVGAYRLDMVALFGEKKVVIECDGEQWHSGDEKIREDMERQCILERSGWRFIRIRGSEYYRNPDKTIERVIEELTAYGIQPEESVNVQTSSRTSELLERVKIRAAEWLHNLDENDDTIDLGIIRAGLNDHDPLINKPLPENPVDSDKQEPEKGETTNTAPVIDEPPQTGAAGSSPVTIAAPTGEPKDGNGKDNGAGKNKPEKVSPPNNPSTPQPTGKDRPIINPDPKGITEDGHTGNAFQDLLKNSGKDGSRDNKPREKPKQINSPEKGTKNNFAQMLKNAKK